MFDDYIESLQEEVNNLMEDIEVLQDRVIRLDERWSDLKETLEELEGTYIEHDRRSEYELVHFLYNLMEVMEEEGGLHDTE